MNESGPRDYRKFLTGTGTLNPSLLPRDVYVAMVYELRDTTDELVRAFEDVFMGFDLERFREQVRAEERVELSPADAARRMFGTLDEKDWWDVMEALELRLQRIFGEQPGRWAHHVDAVYDRQEREGWRRLS